jgi:hypothetical protein
MTNEVFIQHRMRKSLNNLLNDDHCVNARP